MYLKIIILHLYQLFSLNAFHVSLSKPLSPPSCGASSLQGDHPFSLTPNPCSPQPRTNLISGDGQGETQNWSPRFLQGRGQPLGWTPTHQALCPLLLAPGTTVAAEWTWLNRHSRVVLPSTPAHPSPAPAVQVERSSRGSSPRAPADCGPLHFLGRVGTFVWNSLPRLLQLNWLQRVNCIEAKTGKNGSTPGAVAQ